MKKSFKDIETGDRICFFSEGMPAGDGWPAIRSRICKGTAHSLMPADSHVPPKRVWFVQWKGCTLPIGEEDFRGFVERKPRKNEENRRMDAERH